MSDMIGDARDGLSAGTTSREDGIVGQGLSECLRQES